ncbi:Uncharacterised protein [Candidatus Anstonella stagnisolia]|nr:Uncharacterised protein [Candidatus Anstonella stagnisolia]
MSLIAAPQGKITTGPHGQMLLRPQPGLQLQFRPAPHLMGRAFNSKCALCPNNYIFPPQEIDSIGNGPQKARCISIEHTPDGVTPGHQIVIPTPKHNIPFSVLSKAELIANFTLISRAYARIRNAPGIRYVHGLTKEDLLPNNPTNHPHTHIIGSHEINGSILAASKMLQHGSCYFCQMHPKALNPYAASAAKNIWAENEDFVALCPPDAQFEYQVSLISRKHISSFDSMSARALESLAEIFKLVTGALDKITGFAPLKIRYFSTHPAKGPEFHFHLAITPRIVPYWDPKNKPKDFAILIAPPEQRAQELEAAALTLKSS